MRRQKGDDSWNYIRIYSNLKNHVYMHPLGYENLFECVYLKGHPALSASSSDIPAPGSWHSKDVFTPHPSIPEAWKYVTRLDDRVTLVNGEKFLPLPIEGRIRQDPYVREAVIAGVDKSVPCLLVFRDKSSDRLSDDAYLEAIWPTIADANTRAEAFSQITKDMVTILPSSLGYPRTDKGNVIRAQVYETFAEEIQDMYDRLERCEKGGLKLNLKGLEEFVMETPRSTIGIFLDNSETDFFSEGVDSLKAIQMRRILQRTLDLNGKQLATNVVYETGNAKQLARHLALTEEYDTLQENEQTKLMNDLIHEYSSFERHQYVSGFGDSLSNGREVPIDQANCEEPVETYYVDEQVAKCQRSNGNLADQHSNRADVKENGYSSSDDAADRHTPDLAKQTLVCPIYQKSKVPNTKTASHWRNWIHWSPRPISSRCEELRRKSLLFRPRSPSNRPSPPLAQRKASRAPQEPTSQNHRAHCGPQPS